MSPDPVHFVKGHGTQNDFVVLAAPDGELTLHDSLVRALCDRRTGIGGDGVLRAVRCDREPAAAEYVGVAEWFMDYRNADGSLAEMCGNGIRVFARYLVESGLVVGERLAIGTRAGLKYVDVRTDGRLTVDMGPAVDRGESEVVLGGRRLTGRAVSVGNPHLVCELGAAVALSEMDLSMPPAHDAAVFPTGVNVEVTTDGAGDVPDCDRHVRMRVHERGVGETRSCGTGAVAVGFAALGGSTGRVAVDLPGGRLLVDVTADTTRLTGPAVLVAGGQLDPDWLSGVLSGVA